ncbi:CgeB family protein [Acidisoma sp. 7E03]
MRFVIIGLTLSSSWGNGHATTYRALLRALAQLGHEVLFLERNQPWYAAHRDMPAPDFCELALYQDVEDLSRFRTTIAAADIVILGSYTADGVTIASWLSGIVQRGLLCFYDIDTPVTLQKLYRGDEEYLARRTIPLFDLYLSFTGGPTLRHLEQDFDARRAVPLYCSVDADRYKPVACERRWDLGYLGTYSVDRQPALERLLLEPARRAPERRFVVAGAQYPATIDWPDNVERIEHLPPTDHPHFYSAQAWTLNITRADMIAAGYSPSVRLFEAAGCGTPVLTDEWPGLETFFPLGEAIKPVRTSTDVLAALAMAEDRRQQMARRARVLCLRRHTATERARDLVHQLEDAKAQSEQKERAAL